jgi:hypothetical protein
MNTEHWQSEKLVGDVGKVKSWQGNVKQSKKNM